MPEPEQDTWRARIEDIDGHVQGAGVLLTNYQVLTCAHVVAAALGGYTGNQPPEGELRVDFTAHELVRGRWRAWVDPRGWIPPERGDLAILEIAGQPPPRVTPAQLRRCGPPGNREVELYRYAPDLPDEVMTARMISEEQTPSGKWINLDGELFARYQSGFDGTGIIEKSSRNLIGCLTAGSASGQQPRILRMEDAVELLRSSGAQLTLGQAPRQLPPELPTMQGQLTSTSWSDYKKNLEIKLVMICAEITRADLKLIVQDIQRSFGPYFSVPYMSAASTWVDFQYIRSLLNACLEQPGATSALFTYLETWSRQAGSSVQLETDFTSVQRLVERVDPDQGQLPADLRLSLYDLIANVSFGVAAEAYEAADVVGAGVPAYASDPVTMARELERASSNPGDLPLVVRFAEELAKRVSRDIRDELREWVDRYGDLRPALLAKIDECRYSPSPPKGRPVLVLEVDYDNPASGRYKLTAALHYSEALSESRPVRWTRGISLYEPQGAQDLNAVFDLTDELLSCIRQPPSERNPVVEFAVPQSMLDYGFDQWLVGAVLPRPLGTDRPVVVRMLGRSRSTLHLEKWFWLLNRGQRVDPAAVYWLWQSAPQRLAQVLGGVTPVCAAFGIPASPHASNGTDDFSVAIRSGIPVMLWPRTQSPQSAYQELRRMLAQNSVLALPDQIWAWRATVAKRPSQWLGKHLTLMYDDPIRTTKAASSDGGKAERGPG